MNNTDKNQFKEILDGMADMYNRDPLSVIALKMYFDVLIAHDIDIIVKAAEMHMRDPKSGQYFPKPADFIKYIEGESIDENLLIAMAKLKDCPLGILARIHIGSYDLGSPDTFYLRQRATECLQQLPEWKERAAKGDYTDHEISIMLKYGVNPSAPFANGLEAPANIPQLNLRAEAISRTENHQKLLEPVIDPDDDSPVVVPGKLKALVQGIKTETKESL